jgi:hypothetical protein
MTTRSLAFILLLSTAALLALGCEEKKPAESDRGRVNIGVNTPGGNVGIDVTYPKKKDDADTKVKVDHDD